MNNYRKIKREKILSIVEFLFRVFFVCIWLNSFLNFMKRFLLIDH